MKFNHEDHEEHKGKIEGMPRWFLRKLLALRGERSFGLKCKAISIGDLQP